jgi:transposase
MIQITPHIRIFLCKEPVDFRKGIDGLASICRNKLSKDPFSGSMFIFSNKKRTTLKILLYDGQGFWLFIKRLSKGRFSWWPNNQNGGTCTLTLPLSAPELHLLIWNGDPSTASIGSDWKKIAA